MMLMRGFSLLEILITLVIIGIISLFSIPLYTEHLVHEKRLAAEIMLEKISGALENYFLQHNSYQAAELNSLGFSDKIGSYRFALALLTDDAFQLEAIPEDDQALRDLACGSLLLNSRGEKGIKGQGQVENCW